VLIMSPEERGGLSGVVEKRKAGKRPRGKKRNSNKSRKVGKRKGKGYWSLTEKEKGAPPMSEILKTMEKERTAEQKVKSSDLRRGE